MVTNLLTLAQYGNNGGNGGGIAGLVFIVIYLAIIVLVIAGMWKMFAKAGQPGWLSIIPIVNMYFILKIVGRPWWWLILMFIPFISIIFAIIVMLDLAKSFGKGIAFAVGLILLSFVFIPILGFGSAEYQGPAAA